MNKALLQSYKIEYETSDISIEDLCKKYDIATKDLKGYTKWQKILSSEDDIIDEPEPQKTIDILDTNIVTNETKEVLLDDIDTFKRLAVKQAVKFIKEDAQFAEVKEFKDMVAIVDSIEKSYKDVKDPIGTTINIAIQNLVERFSDDC